MPPRIQGINDEVDALNKLSRDVQTLKDTVNTRALPPGFVFQTNGTSLSIRRVADNAVQVIFP